MPQVRRSELRTRRLRRLVRTVVVSAALVAMVLFLHFVALPMSESGALHSFGR
ncbi:MAG: hypothetical protein ABI564_17920 [Ideonella sp.]